MGCDGMTYLTSATDRELSEFAFHVGAGRIVALVVAERVVLVIDHFAVDVIVAGHAQLTEVLQTTKRAFV